MKGLNHPNIVQLFACCTEEGKDTPLLITEFCGKGDLKGYLTKLATQRTYRGGKNIRSRKEVEEAPFETLLLWCYQVRSIEINDNLRIGETS